MQCWVMKLYRQNIRFYIFEGTILAVPTSLIACRVPTS